MRVRLCCPCLCVHVFVVMTYPTRLELFCRPRERAEPGENKILGKHRHKNTLCIGSRSFGPQNNTAIVLGLALHLSACLYPSSRTAWHHGIFYEIGVEENGDGSTGLVYRLEDGVLFTCL